MIKRNFVYKLNSISFILFPLLLWLIFVFVTDKTPYSISRVYYSDLRMVFIIGMFIILLNHLLIVISEKRNKYRFILSILLTFFYGMIIIFPTSYSQTSETHVGFLMIPILISHLLHRYSVLIYFSLYLMDMFVQLLKSKFKQMYMFIPFYFLTMVLLIFGIALDFDELFFGYTYLMEIILLDIIAIYFYFISKRSSMLSSDIMSDRKPIHLGKERRD